MEEYNKAYKGLNLQQKQAVDQIDGPVLVIAGPGTGKTHLLTTRIAHILQKTDTLPQNILCLTFTDSAAHTMLERLSGIIGQAAYDVTLSTYHSFGSDLIRRYPESFTNSSELRPIEELGIDILIRSILNDLPYSNPIKSEFFLRDIKSLLSDAKRAALKPEDIRKITDNNESFCKTVQPILDKTFKDFKRLDKKSVSLFESLATQTSKISHHSSIERIQPINELWQQSLEVAIEKSRELDKTSPLTKWKDHWLAKNADSDFIVAVSNSISKQKAFASIYDKYQQELEKHQLFDYDDMIGQAITGLENNPDLRYTLQERYQYILLDEFQDTNAAQLRLIELLTDNPVNEGRPNIFAVGDDDQAIYAFQGADYSNMVAYTKLYKEVKPIRLTENYRSTDSILHLATAISDQITERLNGDGGKVLTSNVSLGNANDVQRNEFKSDVAQYAWVAQEIKQLIKRGIKPNQIAVLAPQHKYLELLVPYLHHAGLAVHYEKRENVLNDPNVISLILMAKLVLSLSVQDFSLSDSLWPEVLSASFWGIPTDLLWKLSWEVYDNKQNWTNVLFENKDTKQIAQFFSRLSTLAGRESLENMLDYLIGIASLSEDDDKKQEYRSPFYEFYFGEKASDAKTSDFWQLLSNLTVLRQHLREYQSGEPKPLFINDFIEFVDAHEQANINIINTNPYYESSKAVELMTAYKAKGQEFKAVYVLACLDEVWGSGARRRSSSLGLPDNLQFIRYAGSTNDEQLRLFYVALTRAKQYLYLTSYQSTYTNKLLNRLKFLNETSNEDGSITSPLMPAGSTLVNQKDNTAPELASLTLYWQQRHNEAISNADLKDLLIPRLQYFQISPTHVNQYVDVIRNGPREFFINTLLRFPRAKQPSAQFGTAIHETLQWMNAYTKNQKKVPTENMVLENFEKHLRDKRLLKSQEKLLLERGEYAILTYLKQRAEQIRAESETEFNFRKEGIFVNDAHLTGNIDKLIIDRENKKLKIIDYKTGKNYKNWSSDLVLHKYRKQLYAYKIMAENSRSFRDYTVTDAYLEFVEPDGAGNITELHLKFDDREQKQLEQLIGSVWRKVMQLDFPDVTSYPQTLKGIELFESELINKLRK